jgi:hypothetical protein
MRAALAATLLLFGLTACGSDDNACLELAMKECACCEAALVESCKQAARDANDRNPPPDEGISLCQASLDKFSSCSDLSPQKLKPICDGTAFK